MRGMLVCDDRRALGPLAITIAVFTILLSFIVRNCSPMGKVGWVEQRGRGLWYQMGLGPWFRSTPLVGHSILESYFAHL